MTPSANCRIGVGSTAAATVQADETIVVIDALRASSTIATACELGVGHVVPVLDDDRAFSLQRSGVVIAGEADCLRIEGYDLGNSPVELSIRYHDAPFTKLALKTTNLIPLLLSLPHAVICSPLNLAAVAAYLGNRKTYIIAAGGTRGCAEDLGVSLSLAAALQGIAFPDAYVTAFIRESAAAGNLTSKGLAGDVDFIARMNVFNAVPYYDGTEIRKIY